MPKLAAFGREPIQRDGGSMGRMQDDCPAHELYSQAGCGYRPPDCGRTQGQIDPERPRVARHNAMRGVREPANPRSRQGTAHIVHYPPSPFIGGEGVDRQKCERGYPGKERQYWNHQVCLIFTGESKAKAKKYYQVMLRKDSGKPDTAFSIDPPAELDSVEAVMYKAKRKAN